ncbi:MAG: AAA family ATPase [Deltaproteobacteria bacterium]|jgi:type II secretory pathway predicted ATPase ExeA|nr:AAA family ATPase [Deltaproteobacteria bacterium]
MDYEEFFKLNDRPFKATLEAKFFYRGTVFENLCQILSGPRLPGLLLLRGHQGSGKSTLVRRLPQAVRDATRMAPVLDPSPRLGDILREALNFLGLGFKCPPSAREEELIGFFQNAVSEYVGQGLGLALAVDEAQDLDGETTSDLMALASLEPGWRGRVSLMLAGPSVDWPPPALQGLGQVVELAPFGLNETMDYVRFRLGAAGATRDLFSTEALTTLQSYSHGLARQINALADKALMTAWAAGKSQISNNHVIQAKASLDNPLTVDTRAAKVAAGSGRERHHVAGRSWPSLMAAILIVGAMVWLLWPSPDGPEETVAAEEAPDAGPQPMGPVATPAADPADEGSMGLPSLPTTILRLPQSTVALVVESGQRMARLWQGGLSGPGLKAEIAAPDIREPGLYLVGRPRSRTPIIFRYPPENDVPKAAADKLWQQVESMLPQDVLPLVVGRTQDLAEPVPQRPASSLAALLDKWTVAQRLKRAEDMAALYAESFSFFEPGRKPVSISRRNFRLTLESEAMGAGEVTLAISDPLIMLDPTDHGRAWAVFTLKYDSKLRHNIGLRTLILEKNRSNEWLIVAELWLKEDAVKN